ncbi:MAG: phosphatidate cytidylyltransferase [Ruminococcus sp.]|nr:phosphatidate cytidylyltransferase [Ruminococcus sp.]
MFKTRLLSGILLVILALVTILTGGTLLFATVAAISVIGMRELYRVFQMENKLMGVCGYVFLLLYYGLLLMRPYMGENAQEYLTGLFLAFLICLMAVMVFSYPGYHANQLLAAFFGLFYVGVMLSYIYQIRILPGGAYTVWLVFICSWGCDTCAYCVGMLIGKHKMAPRLSPKKSVEGGVGGVVGAALLGLLYAAAINHWGNAGVDVLSFAVIGAVGGAISQVGDLGASAIKRNYDIKDYGTLIPGHGGILDRFDSVIFTAPIIYFLWVFLG